METSSSDKVGSTGDLAISKSYRLSPQDVFDTKVWERGPIPLSRWVIVAALFSGVFLLAITDMDPKTKEFIYAREFRYDLFLFYGSPIAIYALWPLIHLIWLKFVLRGVAQTEFKFQVDQRGYTEHQGGLSITLSWDLLWQAVESDWYIWLKFTKARGHIVFPKRYFLPAECNALRQLILSHAPPGARVTLHELSRDTDMPFGLAQ